MDQQTISTSLAPEVIIEQVHGNLQVEGGEEPQVAIKANPSDLTLQEQDDVVKLACQGNCAVRLPAGSTVRVQKVHGEARVQGVERPAYYRAGPGGAFTAQRFRHPC